MRGIPGCVSQEEEKSKKKQLLARGTTKAAVLKGYPDCPDLLAMSVCATKPDHYLSMVSNELKWMTVKND